MAHKKHGFNQLLIDADGYIFSTACVCERPNPFDPEAPPIVDTNMGEAILKKRFNELFDRLRADSYLMFLSCKREEGHRRLMVDESYKANRNNKKSPEALKHLRKWVEDNYECVSAPHLEADDLIGIYATEKQKIYNRIIVSFDKDVVGLPGKTYHPKQEKRRLVKKTTSFKFFIYQCIVGDSADGYKGIPRVGKVGANKFLASCRTLREMWPKLLEFAASKGCDEEYMLKQARMAYLCRAWNYDFDTGDIRLFDPEVDIEKMITGEY